MAENLFEQYAQKRQQEQKKIEKHILDSHNKEPRTNLTLSLTRTDKKKLKQLAIEQDITVAALIHSWIEEKSQNNSR